MTPPAPKSVKAEAWRKAAQWLAGTISIVRATDRKGALTPVEQHVVDAVIPALMRRADIIERNRRK